MMARTGHGGRSACEENPPCPGDDGKREHADSTTSQPARAAEPRRFSIGVGEPLPLGMTETCDGFNFAVFSRHASGMSYSIRFATAPAISGIRRHGFGSPPQADNGSSVAEEWRGPPDAVFDPG